MHRTKKVAVLATLMIATPAWRAIAQDQTPEPEPPKEERPKEARKEEPAITATLKDGIHFRSADGNLDATLGGYAGLHYRFTAHRPKDNTRSMPDSWFLRQVRPEIAGTVYRDFEFRVQYEFATGATSAVVGSLQDAYIGWRYFPEASLRLGQFKEPFGQEQTTGDRFIDFAERSQGDRFTPQRDLGAMIHGRLFDNVLGYEVGTFNGQGRGVIDQNKGKEIAGRLRFQPFATADDDFLFKLLRLGVAATTGTVQKAVAGNAGNTGFFDVTTQSLGILYLDSTAGTVDGDRKRLGGEITWNAGPVGLRGELWRRVEGIDNGAFDNRRVTITAWNASATWLVTGEKKPVEGRVLPESPFDPRTGGWGALELTFRVDRVRIGTEVFKTGVASATGNSNAVTGTTFGVNWYLTRHIRIQPNLFWEVFDDPVGFAGGRTDRHFFGGILRFQLEF